MGKVAVDYELDPMDLFSARHFLLIRFHMSEGYDYPALSL